MRPLNDLLAQALIPLLLLPGCTAMPETEHQQRLDALQARDRAWKAAAAERDLDGMMAIYAPDAREMLPGMPAVEGREAIRDFYAGLIEQFPRFAHHFEADDIILSDSGDLAVVRGRFRFTADTRKPDEVQAGKFVGVWEYDGERWWLKINISNSDA